MDITYKISNLVVKSFKRDAMLQNICEYLALEYPGFPVLCHASCPVSGESSKMLSIKSIALQRVWDESVDQNLKPELRVQLLMSKVRWKLQSQTLAYNDVCDMKTFYIPIYFNLIGTEPFLRWSLLRK